jgi:hypothetical protein
VLIAAVAFLSLSLVVALMVRSGRRSEPGPAPLPPAEPAPTAATARPRDDALLRAHRAQAVDAIETGDYDSAVKTLTEIVRSGRGVGDEPELLRIAKDLQEKHSQRAVAKEPAPAEKSPPVEVVAEREKEPQKEPAKEPQKEPAKEKEKDRKPEPKHAAKPSKPPPREERKVASAKPVPVIPDREPESGQVLVMSVPSALTAEVDGAPAGSTPTRYSASPGVHTVTLYRGNQKLAERSVTVAENAVATVDFDVRDQLQSPGTASRETEKEREREKEATQPSPEPEKVSKVEPTPPPPPPTTPASAVAGLGEVMVAPVSLAGDVFINGRSYGRPPVLARDVPVGSATVELRVGDAVKRSKVVPVEAHQRATVKFR